ncbi:MAG: right-handed parallel beta-helix repeat-containing protein [Kiritimatiellae bacterium]|nr:right-handed parallel beta-helix repeat-containing protein [Kiritimatiellia bacterium]
MANTDKIQATFYVAPNGNDTNPGTVKAPFATLTRARDAIRELKKAAGEKGLQHPVMVMVRGGKYYLNETLILSNEDSGMPNCPITWRAYLGEKPIISGGRVVFGWKVYKGNILQAEFPGIRDDDWKCRQLFFNGKRQPRARWPKCNPENPKSSDWLKMEGPAEEGSKTLFRYRHGAFRQSWKKPYQGEVNYYYYAQWSNSIVPIKRIDEENRIITLAYIGYEFEGYPWYVEDHSPGLQTFLPDNRFCVENILEELDQPGEWCFDSEENMFYFWFPAGSIKDGEIVVPVLDCLVDLRNTSWLTISGFTFTETTDGDNLHHEGTDGTGAMYARVGLRYVGDGLHLKNTEHCRIENNCFDSVGGNAIYLESSCSRNLLRHNEIRGAGASGICLAGSVLKHPIFNEVSDNNIHHCGVLNKYSAGVFLGMSDGNYISHNHIEHLPHHGINLADNPSGRNVVEFNEIRYVCEETIDNAAINCWMERPPKNGERCGHIIRFNLIADCFHIEVVDGKAVDIWHSFGIYLDNYTSNCLVYGNIIIHATFAGVMVHGGKNNIIENNIFMDCRINFKLQNCIAEWRYWKLQGFDDFMTGNHFSHNVCYQSKNICPQYPDPNSELYLLSLHMWTDRVLARCDYNLVFWTGKGQYTVQQGNEVPEDQKIKSFDRWRALGYDEHSIIADPLFMDIEHGDYRLRPESPALTLGFQPIPFDRIGVRKPQ